MTNWTQKLDKLKYNLQEYRNTNYRNKKIQFKITGEELETIWHSQEELNTIWDDSRETWNTFLK